MKIPRQQRALHSLTPSPPPDAARREGQGTEFIDLHESGGLERNQAGETRIVAGADGQAARKGLFVLGCCLFVISHMHVCLVA